jgi:hypothetical protein
MAYEFMPPFCSGLLSVAMCSRYFRADGLIERTNGRKGAGYDRRLKRCRKPTERFRFAAYRMLDHFMLTQDTCIRE